MTSYLRSIRCPYCCNRKGAYIFCESCLGSRMIAVEDKPTQRLSWRERIFCAAVICLATASLLLWIMASR